MVNQLYHLEIFAIKEAHLACKDQIKLYCKKIHEPTIDNQSKSYILAENNEYTSKRIKNNQILIKKERYFFMDQILWRESISLLGLKKGKETPSEFDSRLILLNPKAQKLARRKKEDEGNPDLFDLYFEFLKVASRPKKGKKRDLARFNMCFIALQISNYILTNFTEKEKREVTLGVKDVQKKLELEKVLF